MTPVIWRIAMYGLNKDFAAPHTGIVLGASEIIAPIVYTLAMLLIKGISKALAVLSYIMFPPKKLTLDGQALSNAPHVALIADPGNFVTSTFKT
jgi:hypothetical protein